MRDIDDEANKNDWVRAIIDVPGVGGGVVDRLAELDLPVVPYNGGEAPIDKERFVNARAEDFWTLRERFEQGSTSIPMTTSSPLSSVHQVGHRLPRSDQDRIERRHAQARAPVTGSGRRDGHSVCWPRECSADERGESRRRKHHWGLDDEGLVTAGPARCDTAKA
jgi:hypothetical protein